MTLQQKIEHVLSLITILMLALSVVGTALPADSKLGQFLRRISADWANRNLKSPPPEEKKPS